jgi:hypothetical protein
MAIYDKNNREIRQGWIFVESIKKIKELAKKKKVSMAEMIEELLKNYKEG